jgi:sodium transport system permease protein
MNFSNVKLILAREVRDQLRDRRTLFMIFVLPVLLYPLLGTAYFQMFQFQTRNSITVQIVGGGQLAAAPVPLVEGGEFSSRLFPNGAEGAKLLKVVMSPDRTRAAGDAAAPGGVPASAEAEAERLIQNKEIDAALVFPPDFAKRIEDYRNAILHDAAGKPANGKPAASPVAEIPRPMIIYNSSLERSEMASNRLTAVLDRWTDELGKSNIVAAGMPAEAVRPFEIQSSNLAGESAGVSGSVWSRILPVMLLLWAMTGAFYPAVDLCAGEKERGTLETLLSSPAQRSEIVVGKLLTIMAFSMITAALNLLCVGGTGFLVFREMKNFGMPPALSVVWLSLALIPVSALFSALCLALASFARSTKEGQYYLMPLLMLSLPLAMLPMSPGVELSLGNSLIPVSGLVLLLKTLLEGSYIQALQYLPIVLAVTLAACWLAVRWAVEQFNKESVIFRESERFAVGLWLRSLRRDRGPTPSAAEGLFCAVVILAVTFVLRTWAGRSDDFDIVRGTVVVQLAAILTPAAVMALVLTGSPRQTLLLRLPRWRMVFAAAALAVALHPFIEAMGSLVNYLYPMSPEMTEALKLLDSQFASTPLGLLIVFAALMPAICEELAFRGFILSGFRNLGGDWRAIVASAVFFGAAHGILQHSINAAVMGIVLGYLAVRSGSLLPCVTFHFLHNAMIVLSAKVTTELVQSYPILGYLVRPADGGFVYRWPIYLFGGVTGLALLGWFAWFPEARTPEDVLQEAFRGTADSPVGAEQKALPTA